MTTVIPLRADAPVLWEPLDGAVVSIRSREVLTAVLSDFDDFAAVAWVHSHKYPRNRILVGSLGEDGWVLWLHDVDSSDVSLLGWCIVRVPQDPEALVFEPFDRTDFAGMRFVFEAVQPDAGPVAQLVWEYANGEGLGLTYSLAPRIDTPVLLPQRCASVSEALRLLQDFSEATFSDEAIASTLDLCREIGANEVIVIGALRFTVRIPRSESRVQFQILDAGREVRVSGLQADIGGTYSLLLPRGVITRDIEEPD